MATIYVTDHLSAGRPPALTGMKLTVQYDGVTAEILLQGFAPLSEPKQNSGIAQEILRLGQEIIQAAQSPQGILAGQQPPP